MNLLEKTSALSALRRAALLATSSALILGCGNAPGDEARTSAEAEAQTGALIADHPQFGPLSDNASSRLASIVAGISSRTAAEIGAMKQTLQGCVATGDPSPCMPILGGLGISTPEVLQDAASARQIATAVGLDGAAHGYVLGSFRSAQLRTDGAGSNSELTTIGQGAGFPCDFECLETLGNVLGGIKGGNLGELAASSDDGGAGEAGVIILIITVVIEVATWLEDVIWNSDEEDKECVDDSNCPSGQYCHKVGDNDCRPLLSEGQLCSRNGNCASDCCKPHISAAFLPICRPRDKC